MLRLVIFDVDGTLVDSQGIILAAMGRAFARAGRPAPLRESALGIVGLSLPEAMAALVPEAGPEERAALVAAYKHAFAEIRAEEEAGHPPFYPGALDGIARLDGAGYLLGIATGKARRGLEHMLDLHDLRTRFVATQTADDAPSKPHPAMVLNCLAATGAEAAGCVVVGDTEYDMAMARAAGARAIGVGWGYHDRARLGRGGAEVILPDFAAVDDAVAEMVGRP
jgi:phosphoglycolate phosphatase